MLLQSENFSICKIMKQQSFLLPFFEFSSSFSLLNQTSTTNKPENNRKQRIAIQTIAFCILREISGGRVLRWICVIGMGTWERGIREKRFHCHWSVFQWNITMKRRDNNSEFMIWALKIPEHLSWGIPSCSRHLQKDGNDRPQREKQSYHVTGVAEVCRGRK
jgi:hypothetical protein